MEGGKQGYREREGNVTLANQRRWRARGSRKGQRNGDDGKMGLKKKTKKKKQMGSCDLM